MIVGEAPGDSEEREGIPFVGYSGQELNRMLSDAGISRSECFLTNVIRKRPPGNNVDLFFADKKKDITLQHVNFQGRMCLPAVIDGIEMLKREIELCRPNVIIALGNTALWALTGQRGITNWRGSVLPCSLDLPGLGHSPKVVPSYHPALVLRQFSWRGIAVHDLKRAKKESLSDSYVPPDYNFIIRPNYGQAITTLEMLLKELDKGPRSIVADMETRAGHIACIGFAWTKLHAICIPLMCVERPDGYWTSEEEVQITHRIIRILRHPNLVAANRKGIIGQNYLYDAQYSWRWWHFEQEIAWDTMIAQHSVFSNQQKSLDYLASLYCEHYVYWKGESKDWDPKIGEDQLWTYNCKDCVHTYEVAEGQMGLIESMTETWPKLPAVVEFQQRLLKPVLRTMNRGIPQDRNLQASFALRLMEEVSARQAWLYNVVGRELNPKSSKQMQEFFYDECGQRPIFKRGTTNLTCDDEALQKISSREPLLRPIIRRVLELRSLGVFLSTFIQASLDSDGRIRCSFNVGGTETYRFSSSQNAFGSGLNLQNIPKGGDDDDGLVLPNVRELFVPDPGHTFFDIDLDSADLRVVTWESGCKEMKAMFAEGKKPYVEVAKEYYHDQSITKHHPKYGNFKSLCHGTNYLGTAAGIAGQPNIAMPVHEVDRIQKWYFGKFPEIKSWQEDFKDQVTKRRYIENIFGYRCYFFGRIQGNVFNEAVAWLPQSTVACLINRGYVNIEENLPEVQVLLQVHDSLAGQYGSHLGDWAKRRIVEECSIELPYPDPLTIPVGIKVSTKSWGECD